jgi:hypothetical protein
MERDMGQRTEANERMGVHNIRLFFSLAKGNLSFFSSCSNKFNSRFSASGGILWISKLVLHD